MIKNFYILYEEMPHRNHLKWLLSFFFFLLDTIFLSVKLSKQHFAILQIWPNPPQMSCNAQVKYFNQFLMMTTCAICSVQSKLDHKLSDQSSWTCTCVLQKTFFTDHLKSQFADLTLWLSRSIYQFITFHSASDKLSCT